MTVLRANLACERPRTISVQRRFVAGRCLMAIDSAKLWGKALYRRRRSSKRYAHRRNQCGVIKWFAQIARSPRREGFLSNGGIVVRSDEDYWHESRGKATL